jgi:hypothetical protein
MLIDDPILHLRRRRHVLLAADTPMIDQETADEIAQIEHELEILRSRQALMARWDRIEKICLKIALVVTPPLFAILVYVSTSDLFMAGFIGVMTLVVAMLIWIIGTRAIERQLSVPLDGRRPSQFLPTNVSIGPPAFRELPFSSGIGLSSGLGPSYKSDAETIEDMIVLRKQRLAELKGEPPPSVPSVSASGRTPKARRGLSKR